ncbi:MAG TPA: glycosyltransferase family 39 protein [Candidatus Udaeobacter sp.]|nr:glycosyltransferase family 39 protein [Candidatus Udaeobacter sp.]
MTAPSAAPPSSRTGRALFAAAALALLALRLPHLKGPLTDPHSWRQDDTVHFALDFYRRGLDLLHPHVTWLGAHQTIVLNFPFSEAITALLYRAFGPDPMWDRLVALSLFIVSAAYVRGIARRLAGERVSVLATLAYLAFPLGQYFSRVPHIEFSVLAFVDGTLYHSIRACSERRMSHTLAAIACATIAALVKAPYLGTLAVPLLLVFLAAPTIANAMRLAAIGGVSGAAFILWRHHVDTVNATVPDWYFLPDFYKEVNPMWRYTGTLAEREQLGNWVKIAKRLVYELATPVGLVLGLPSVLGGRHDPTRPPAATPPPGARAVAFGWLLGCLALVVVFFRLSLMHNYYQLPFLAPVALLIGLGADALWQRLPSFRSIPLAAILFTIFLAIAAWTPRMLGYDHVDWLRIEAGRAIAAHVPATDLVVAGDFNTLPPTDPRLLCPADRNGWPMRVAEITPDRIAKLRPYGAKWVVVLTDPEHPEVHAPGFLAPAEVASVPVRHGSRTLGTLHVFELSRLASP